MYFPKLRNKSIIAIIRRFYYVVREWSLTWRQHPSAHLFVPYCQLLDGLSALSYEIRYRNYLQMLVEQTSIS